MTKTNAGLNGFHRILEQKEIELGTVLRKRDGMAIEKSAEEMDQIQNASEREMAIRNADRDSRLLREVRDTLRRIHDGTFGICVDCESAINPKRLAAVPWASRCIQCQAAADGVEASGTLVNAA